MPGKCAEFVPWVADLTGRSKSTEIFLRLFLTSFFVKKDRMNMRLVVTALLLISVNKKGSAFC